MDIAYALLLANKQWGSNKGINYLAEGKKVIQAILEKDVNHREWTLKLGDWAGDSHPQYGTGLVRRILCWVICFALLQGTPIGIK
ncbi:hypothetical protein [Kroppenstedtia pulmonis]|uniref:hypothetical protein n=1 Tax=Kroppenstedtia pulmonis TaxID=1380685 RepID=UPI002483EB3B|nr:hypothetical protein [Kroppenstedtia pulmonis]